MFTCTGVCKFKGRRNVGGMFISYCFSEHDKRKRDVIVPEKYGIQVTDKGHTNLGNMYV